jgi:osmotically-inducible protein OsmY
VDEARRLRVETALRLDPYFYDAHVSVLLVKGVVVLQGFVFSDWDLIDAIRIANKAAGDGRVVNALSIEVGGRR